MIKIYPSTLTGEPIEEHYYSGSLESWLLDNVDGFVPGKSQPISATVDGQVVFPENWSKVDCSQEVELRVEPKGMSTIIYAVIAVISIAAGFLMRPKSPNMANSGKQRGLLEASGAGNQVKLGEVIPDIAGRHKIYPDYLSAPRRYFTKREEQSLDLLLCLGVGELEVEELKIGETLISNLDGFVDYRIFPPSTNLSSHIAHKRWYNVPEVGGTNGGSGLLLTTLKGKTLSAPTGDYTFVNNEISDVPKNWTVGDLLRVVIPRNVDVETNGSYEIFKTHLEFEPKVNDIVVVRGGINKTFLIKDVELENGLYSIRFGNFSGDAQNPRFEPGSYSVSFENENIRYKVLSANNGTITVEQLLNGESTNWAGFGTISVTDPDITFVETADSFYAGPFAACPNGEVTDVLEWDIFCPQGLGRVSSKGRIDSRKLAVELCYREAGTEEWTSVKEFIQGGSRNQLGWTMKVNLPKLMRPEVKVRRVSPQKNGMKWLDKIEWYGLRAELPAKKSYKDITTLAVTVKGSNNLSQQTENKVNAVVTRKLNGVPTRKIDDYVRYVCQSVGASVDENEMDRLGQLWDARGDYFDFVHNSSSTVKEVINRALAAGFADLTISKGAVRPVRDEKRLLMESMYTPQNMTQELSRTVTASRHDDPDGIDVEYMDADSWATEVVECRLGGDLGNRAQKMKVEGVTDKTRAWRIGMRERRKQKYIRWIYNFSTELDALNSQYMSYVALADDCPSYGQSALIEHAVIENKKVRITVSEPINLTGNDIGAWRNDDGSISKPISVFAGKNEREVILNTTNVPEIKTDREPPHILIGSINRWTFPALVTEVTPQGYDGVDVIAVNYDERVYLDDDSKPS